MSSTDLPIFSLRIRFDNNNDIGDVTFLSNKTLYVETNLCVFIVQIAHFAQLNKFMINHISQSQSDIK